MSRFVTFVLFLFAVFLQAGAYGLTFLLPRLFERFGADEKAVGITLTVATVSTLVTVYYAGHLSDWFGRVMTLAVACVSISASMALFGVASSMGPVPIFASLLMGAGWGLTYALVPVVLTRLVTAEERVRYFAINSVVLMAGFGLSPVMASTIEKTGGTVVDAFMIVAVLSLFSAVLFFILIGPVRAHAINPGPEESSRLSLPGVSAIFRSPALLPVTMVFLGASVFAGMSNFQTVYADARGLDYAAFFLIYTVTVVICRIVLARNKGGSNPYLTIAALQYVMAGSVLLFIFSGSSQPAYWLVAVLFGVGYGASYPILAAMAANDADSTLVPQTLQLFALTYFIGIFGFPLLAGWMIVEVGVMPLLVLVCLMAAVEASMGLRRAIHKRD
ncbi:MAG: MFS transporter [Pseudomonadota bacterium]